jgi:ATP-dependent Clp protease ATP-binding subunit ClpX
MEASRLLESVEPEDLLSFGMIPEFIGRLPILTSLQQLTETELIKVLTEPRNALVKQFTKLLAMDDITLTVTKDALSALAESAVKKGTGARALRTLLEKIMLDVMYEAPDRDDLVGVTLNRAVVEGRRSALIRRRQDKNAA